MQLVLLNAHVHVEALCIQTRGANCLEKNQQKINNNKKVNEIVLISKKFNSLKKNIYF